MIEKIPFSLLVFLAIAVWWGVWIYVRLASGMLALSRMLVIGFVGTLLIVLISMHLQRQRPPDYPSPVSMEVAVFSCAEEDREVAMDARYALRLGLEIADPQVITDIVDTPEPATVYDEEGVLPDSTLARAHRHHAHWLVRGEIRSGGEGSPCYLSLILTRLDAEGGPVRNIRMETSGGSGAEAGLRGAREILTRMGRKVACEVCLEPYTPSAITAISRMERIRDPKRRVRFLTRQMPSDESLQPLYWAELAKLKWRLGDSDGAYHAASRALSSSTQMSSAWAVLGRVEGRRGNRQEAQRLCQRALAEDPRNLSALLELADLSWRASDREVQDRRELLLKRAVQMRPGNTQARLELANWVEKEMLQPETALRMLREGYDLTGDNRILLRESAVLIRMQHWNQAESVLDRVLQEDPKDANAWYNLGLTLRNLKQLSAAQSALEKSVKLGGPPDVHFVLGLIHEARRDTAAALEEYRLRWSLRDPTESDRTANAAKARVRLLNR